jgi:DNA polymerase-3 subunit epsilon
MAADPSRPLHELEYLVVDVETTGRAADESDRITEVAAVVVQGGAIVDRFASLVRPGRYIPPFIVRLTGITDAMVAHAPPFSAVAHEVASRLDGRVFVAHNASFDWAFISAELARCTGEYPQAETLCTVKLARRLLTHLPRRNLDAVTDYYGVQIAARHRALGDAEATALVLLRMIDDLGKAGVHTWGELQDWLAPRSSRGKKKPRSGLPSPVTDFRIA